MSSNKSKKNVGENILIYITVFCIIVMLAVLLVSAFDGAYVIMGIAAFGIVALIFAVLAVIKMLDSMRSEATERILRMTSYTLEFLRNGLNKDSCQAICIQLLPDTNAIALSITDTERVLAYVGEHADKYPIGTKIHMPSTYKALATGTMQTFSNSENRPVEKAEERKDWPAFLRPIRAKLKFKGAPQAFCGVVVPLIVANKSVGAIKFYYPNMEEIDDTQLALAAGFGEVLSTQLSLYELEKQERLRSEAEVKALQAQINPHFLFNTLNTIAAFTRTDPARARNLLRDFAVFYRQTLQNSESLIPLERELEQTRRYLTFEYARFGENRIAETERIEDGCDGIMVPAFVIQPIVENAVRHAMREEGTLHIDIHVANDDDATLIAVADDGIGMPQEVADSLIAIDRDFENDDPTRGIGMALKNVNERLKGYFGSNSGLEIVSRPDEGTLVTIRISNKK